MTCIVDATVLFPLLVEGHASHEVARRWWAERADADVGICLTTSLTVLRLLTSRTAMNGHPVSASEALRAWTTLCEDPRSFYIESPPVQELPRFASFVTAGHGQLFSWTHAWFSALALTLNLEMVSFDPTFKTFRGLKARVLQPEPVHDRI